jgi:hypothetical protein
LYISGQLCTFLDIFVHLFSHIWIFLDICGHFWTFLGHSLASLTLKSDYVIYGWYLKGCLELYDSDQNLNLEAAVTAFQHYLLEVPAVP